MSNIKNTMLISPDTIKEMDYMDYNLDDSIVGGCIRTAQSVYINDVIGDRLLTRLQELVYNAIVGVPDNIESPENEHYKVLLDDYLSEALARKTISEACLRMSFKLRNVGVTQNSDININATNLQDIKYLRNCNETLYCDSLNRMMDWLQDNRDAFPEIKKKDCWCRSTGKPDLGKRYVNCNIYLDD